MSNADTQDPVNSDTMAARNVQHRRTRLQGTCFWRGARAWVVYWGRPLDSWVLRLRLGIVCVVREGRGVHVWLCESVFLFLSVFLFFFFFFYLHVEWMRLYFVCVCGGGKGILRVVVWMELTCLRSCFCLCYCLSMCTWAFLSDSRPIFQVFRIKK